MGTKLRSFEQLTKMSILDLNLSAARFARKGSLQKQHIAATPRQSIVTRYNFGTFLQSHLSVIGVYIFSMFDLCMIVRTCITALYIVQFTYCYSLRELSYCSPIFFISFLVLDWSRCLFYQYILTWSHQITVAPLIILLPLSLSILPS